MAKLLYFNSQVFHSRLFTHERCIQMQHCSCLHRRSSKRSWKTGCVVNINPVLFSNWQKCQHIKYTLLDLGSWIFPSLIFCSGRVQTCAWGKIELGILKVLQDAATEHLKVRRIIWRNIFFNLTFPSFKIFTPVYWFLCTLLHTCKFENKLTNAILPQSCNFKQFLKSSDAAQLLRLVACQ